MRELDAKTPVGSQMVSIRLPNPILERLDKLAERLGSSRTDVMRRALATYFRMGTAMLVPVSPKTRADLERIAEQRERGIEVVAEELFEAAVKEHAAGRHRVLVRLHTTSSNIPFSSGDADSEQFITLSDPRGRHA